MRFIAIAALALATVATAAVAQETAAPIAHRGDVLRDANALRVGEVSRVYPDGSVQVIFGTRFVIVPASTLATDEGKLKTSLTRREIAKL